jgi:hypothetical protein
MTRIVLALTCAGVIGCAAAAHAQEPPQWRAIEGRCVSRIGEQTGHFPAWAKCTARQLWGWSPAVQDAYASCWIPIWNERLRDDVCQACGGDPAYQTLSCMARRLGK